jgi:two-component system chemotaxis response regulator CheY
VKTQVLVVDPDADTRDLYRKSFERNGCDVVEACDGRDALTKALIRPPALVITEITLPLVDGFALCEILRRDHATNHVPILVVTADARASELSRARRLGASAVLVKPTTPEQMWEETQRLLRDDREPASANRVEAPPAQQPAPRGSRLSKTFGRFSTTTPPVPPPALTCPSCDQSLVYQQSYVGGVSARHREQWDRFVCPGTCGVFQYRHRTRKLHHFE